MKAHQVFIAPWSSPSLLVWNSQMTNAQAKTCSTICYWIKRKAGDESPVNSWLPVNLRPH